MQLKFRFSVLSIGVALALVPAHSTTITAFSNLASWQPGPALGYQATAQFTGYTSSGSLTANGIDNNAFGPDYTFNDRRPGGSGQDPSHDFNYAKPRGGNPHFSEAPEAGTFFLIGSGLIGMVLLCKRMKPANYLQD